MKISDMKRIKNIKSELSHIDQTLCVICGKFDNVSNIMRQRLVNLRKKLIDEIEEIEKKNILKY